MSQSATMHIHKMRGITGLTKISATSTAQSITIPKGSGFLQIKNMGGGLVYISGVDVDADNGVGIPLDPRDTLLMSDFREDVDVWIECKNTITTTLEGAWG
jgi:hypothetical protein